MKLLMLKGLPASGKSTFAKELVLSAPAGTWKRVNKDEMRAMIDAGKWSSGNETSILAIRDHIIELALREKKNVIVDDTNFHPKHEARLRQLADKYGAEFEIKFFDEDVDVCIERDAKRINGVGESVIRRMWCDYCLPRVDWPKNTASLPECIICDLDGTLALLNGRNPYDASTCEKDGLNRQVALVVKGITGNRKLIFMSGREEKYRAETVAWLKSHDFYVAPTSITDGDTQLFMRPTGDKRKDWLVKFEILQREIAPKYNPVLVFDDRTQVVEMWRANGLECWQVAYGDF